MTISREFGDTNRTLISIRLIYRFYNEENEPGAVSSSIAFIYIKDADPSDIKFNEEGDSRGKDNGTSSDNSEGESTIISSTYEHVSSHTINNNELLNFRAVSSFLQLDVVTEFLIILLFCSLIVLSFSVV